MSEKSATRSGFISSRIVHLHPSRFCNLACDHCYSQSGPQHKSALDPNLIIDALEVLKNEGYEVLSLSGGEPLLYTGLEVVIQAANALGFRINLITNGTPVNGRTLDFIEQYVDLVAISMDGAPETHNRMRRNRQAFHFVERAIFRLRERYIKFGLAFCVSNASLSEMPWAVDFATSEGASLLQFHPFAAVGRGIGNQSQFQLSSQELTRAYAIAALLQSSDGPFIQIDLAPLKVARQYRSDYEILTIGSGQEALLSTLINPLIITEAGQLLPFSYGINPMYGLGKIDENLSMSIKTFKESDWLELHDLIKQTFEQIDMQNEGFVDWFHLIVQVSCSQHNHSPRVIGHYLEPSV